MTDQTSVSTPPRAGAQAREADWLQGGVEDWLQGGVEDWLQGRGLYHRVKAIMEKGTFIN